MQCPTTDLVQFQTNQESRTQEHGGYLLWEWQFWGCFTQQLSIRHPEWCFCNIGLPVNVFRILLFCYELWCPNFVLGWCTLLKAILGLGMWETFHPTDHKSWTIWQVYKSLAYHQLKFSAHRGLARLVLELITITSSNIFLAFLNSFFSDTQEAKLIYQDSGRFLVEVNAPPVK